MGPPNSLRIPSPQEPRPSKSPVRATDPPGRLLKVACAGESVKQHLRAVGRERADQPGSYLRQSRPDPLRPPKISRYGREPLRCVVDRADISPCLIGYVSSRALCAH